MLKYKTLKNINSSVDEFKGTFKGWNAAGEEVVSEHVDISSSSFPSNSYTFSWEIPLLPTTVYTWLFKYTPLNAAQ